MDDVAVACEHAIKSGHLRLSEKFAVAQFSPTQEGRNPDIVVRQQTDQLAREIVVKQNAQAGTLRSYRLRGRPPMAFADSSFQ